LGEKMGAMHSDALSGIVSDGAIQKSIVKNLKFTKIDAR
jgi:hypothetical protein